MKDAGAFEETFAALRALLRRHGKRLLVVVDEPGNFQLASPNKRDRIGRPLFIAGVQKKKTYVSFHLIPVYMTPALLEGLSADLRKRMQGKSCFNFTAIQASQLEELGALTKAGIASFDKVKLPWATD